MKKRHGAIAAWLLGLGLSAQFVHATDGKTVHKAEAKESIRKAMDAEMSGDFESREKWIAEAMKFKADSLAHSQKGLLKGKGSEWLSIDDAAAKIAASERMKRYEALRETYVDSVEGNVQIARACVAKHLPDQAKAHFHRVLELDPEHAQARAALGFQKSNGEWIAPERLLDQQKLFKAQVAAVEKHGRMIRELIPMLISRQDWERQRGVDRLSTLRDPSAAIAVEQLISPLSDDMAQLAIRFFSNINDPIATDAIVRHAFHSSQAVRDAAAQQLASRDLHAYAPQLLSQLSMPIRMNVEAIVNGKGDVLGYRQVFERITMERNEVVASETNALTAKEGRENATGSSPLLEAQQPRRAKDANEAQAIAQKLLGPVSLARQNEAAQANVQIALRNDRIFDILRTATRQDLPNDPQSWWNWYENQIGIEVEGRDYRETEQLRQRMVDSGYRRLPPPLPRRKECFVAGTLVTTYRGAVAIETVRVGDMVLSKNIESGELSFSPVLQTTTRAPEELLTIEVGGDQLHCTRGHLFWVSGRGWTKAGDLLAGMVLHGAENPQKIDKISPRASEQTFNLRIADNANYFVGAKRLLSHDVSSRGPTEMSVPGYKVPQQRRAGGMSLLGTFGGMSGMGMSMAPPGAVP